MSTKATSPPSSLTGKDIDITTIAILKSVIEAGVPADQWLPSVQAGWKVFLKVTQGLKAASPKSTPASKEQTDDVLVGRSTTAKLVA